LLNEEIIFVKKINFFFSALLAVKNLKENIQGFEMKFSKINWNDVCTQRAKYWKKTGNRHFGLKDYEMAVEFYTTSLKFALENDEERHIYYSNRSECFLKYEFDCENKCNVLCRLNKISEAESDAREALKICPKHEKSEDRLRRAEAKILDQCD
jgi:tetratricopeptide (TPR) repeat protein